MKNLLNVIGCLAAVCIGSVSNDLSADDARESTGTVTHTEVFERGVGGYHTYRIPAIVVTNDETLLAFCEGRKSGRGDAGNIDMLVRRSTDGGKTWSEPLVVWDDGDNTCGNPAPVVDRETGVIWLLLTWNLGSDHEREIMAGNSKQPRHVYVTHSRDDGLSWAVPQKISETTRQSHWRWYATGPGNAIQLTRGPHRGRLLIPANHSDHSEPEDEERGGKSRILFSSPRGSERANLTVWLSYDEGRTWPVSKSIYAGGSAYSNLVVLPDRRIGVLYEKDGYQTISLAKFDLQWLEGE